MTAKAATSTQEQNSRPRLNLLLVLPHNVWAKILQSLEERRILVLEQVCKGLKQQLRTQPASLYCRLCIAHEQHLSSLDRLQTEVQGLCEEITGKGVVSRPEYLAMRRLVGAGHIEGQQHTRMCRKLVRVHASCLSSTLLAAVVRKEERHEEAAKNMMASAQARLVLLRANVRAL